MDNHAVILAQIAERLTPCPIPNALDGYDSCEHGPWPCPETEAVWLANGLDIDTERRRQTRDLLNHRIPDAEEI